MGTSRTLPAAVALVLGMALTAGCTAPGPRETVSTKEGPVHARCSSGVLTAAIQYLKTFANSEGEGDLKSAAISETLARYAGKMKYGAPKN